MVIIQEGPSVRRAWRLGETDKRENMDMQSATRMIKARIFMESNLEYAAPVCQRQIPITNEAAQKKGQNLRSVPSVISSVS
jgi:hypothetical protein